MKIAKDKALNLINDKIDVFEHILSSVTYENISSDEYAIAYQSVFDLVKNLFSQEKANEFQASTDEWGIPGRETEQMELARHKKHLKKIIVQLKALRENVETFWDDGKTVENSKAVSGTPAIPNTKQVFVVHGRNIKIKESMFQFLRAAGVEPIEWLKAKKLTGKSSPYIGEILKAAFSHAQAVVILFTPDDEARLKEEFQSEGDLPYEKFLTPQARPNVIFEAGMAFGYCEDRTIIVEFGELRPFSDVAGRHVVKFDGSATKRQELVEILRIAGVAVDTEGKSNWLDIGDFSLQANK